MPACLPACLQSSSNSTCNIAGTQGDAAGGAAPLFGAMSQGMSAAQNFTRALHSNRRSTQPASLQRLAATRQQSAGETAAADPKGVQPLEIEVVHEPTSQVEQYLEEDVVRRMLEEFHDEEWKQLAKVCPKSG